MPKRDWFTEAFGHAIADIRHELLAGWFGRGFEPHPLARSRGDGHDALLAQRSGWEISGERTPDMDRANHTQDFDLDR